MTALQSFGLQIILWTCMSCRMLFKFCGSDSEIDLDFADKEFLEYKWAELHDLPDKVVYFKQHVYQLVVLEFGPHIERIKKAATT